MTRLEDLYGICGQSPWLDNLSRDHLDDGRLERLIDAGIRGVTSNPTIFQKAISSGDAYDAQFGELLRRSSVEDAYWEMVIEDVTAALDLFRGMYVESTGGDGFVSIEVAPGLAHDTTGSVDAARFLHRRIERPNLLVKIPATAAGIPAISQMIGEGRSINITLIFSLPRYEEVMEAYLSGLEACTGELDRVHSVASFFVSRVDTEVDRRLEEIGTPAALALRGKAAVAQAKIAYQRFRARFSGPRWDALRKRGARIQRPLWASTSTKNPDYPDLLYVDNLVGPDTVNTMPDATIDAFLDHGTVRRTVDEDVDEATSVLASLADVGVDLADVAATLEDEGVDAFAKSYDELLQALSEKATALGAA